MTHAPKMTLHEKRKMIATKLAELSANHHGVYLPEIAHRIDLFATLLFAGQLNKKGVRSAQDFLEILQEAHRVSITRDDLNLTILKLTIKGIKPCKIQQH